MLNVEQLIAASPEERADILYNLSRDEYKALLEMDGFYNVPFARVFTHVHSDMGSPMDAILTNKQYIETSKTYGTKYLTITDHGTMYDVQSLYDDCQGEDLTVIIGCEFYVCDDDVTNSSLKHTRLHLVAYSIDKQGYLTLARLVTESNYRIIKVGKQQFPCISRELLMKYVGPGSEGHGHVILTSACIGGVLTGISFEQETARKNIGKLSDILKKDQRAYDLAVYSQNKIDSLEEMKSHTSDKSMLDSIKGQISEFKKNITACNTVIKKYNNVGVFTMGEFSFYLQNQKKMIEEMERSIIPESQMEAEMTEAAKWYDNCAGHGNFYIEIQYHGIPAEKKYEYILCKIADSLQIPLIAGVDAHMQKKEDARTRKYVNSLRFKQWDDVEPSDEELYLKTDGELYRWLKNAVGPAYAATAVVNCIDLAERCHVKLEKDNHYPVYSLNDAEEKLIANIPDIFGM